VAVGSYGQFFITNGVISGGNNSNANKILNVGGSSPSNPHGQALYVFDGKEGNEDTSGSAHRGTINENGFQKTGDLEDTDDTINVENGVLTS